MILTSGWVCVIRRAGVEGVAPEVTEAAMQGQTVVYVGKFTQIHARTLDIIRLCFTAVKDDLVLGFAIWSP